MHKPAPDTAFADAGIKALSPGAGDSATPQDGDKIRDLRGRRFLWVDHVVIDGCLARIGPSAFACYAVLCRHADVEQIAFPSQRTIARKTGLSLNTVKGALRTLVAAGLIRVHREGRIGREHSVYSLLDVPESKTDTAGSKTDPGVSVDDPHRVKNRTLRRITQLEQIEVEPTHKKRTQVLADASDRPQEILPKTVFNAFREHLQERGIDVDRRTCGALRGFWAKTSGSDKERFDYLMELIDDAISRGGLHGGGGAGVLAMVAKMVDGESIFAA